jgi:MarC family membrane protein
MDTASILSTFAVTSFALLNPLGMLPIFIGYTTHLNEGAQRWLALLVALTVMGLTLLFLLTGNALISFFGITLDSFRMAGGVLLLLIGIKIVTGTSGNAAQDLATETDMSAYNEAKSVYRQIVVPFAMPLLVGPGLIANLILYAGEARNSHNSGLFLGLVAVTIGLSLVTLLILVSGRALQRMLGDVGLTIMTRILGLLVAAIGMQFMITGLSNIIVHDLAPELLKLH